MPCVRLKRVMHFRILHVRIITHGTRTTARSSGGKTSNHYTCYYAPFRSSVVFSGCIDSSFEIAYEAEVGPVTVYGASHQTCETQTQSWKNLGSKITSLSLLTKSNLMPAFESPLCSNRSRNSATLSCSSFFLPDNTSSILKQTCAINELT